MRPDGDLRELAMPLSRWGKGLLCAEVLATYAQVRWWMRGRQLPEIVARLREGCGAWAAQRDALPPSSDLAAQRLGGLRLGRAVSRTLRLLPTDSRCLVQSLLLTRLLGRRGVPCSLVIGVMAEPEFAAHAWVEYAGTPLLHTGTTYERLVEV